MKDDITYENILYIYEKEISKNIKNKKKVYNFEINKIQNLANIYNMLHNGKVGHSKYNIFLIHEPKQRLVMSLSVENKIINHFITRYVLEKKLTKYLDIRNTATRKNMGTDYALRLVCKYINSLKNKCNKFYILKMDISKYFYSIDHNVLKGLLVDKLDNVEYRMISDILKSTNATYINDEIKKIMYRHNTELPLYDTDKGLPIGNMTSQFLSIFYLYKIDHFIVHDLKLKYYVRYMDDFIIMDESKEKLEMANRILTKMLLDEYKLVVNKKKTFITDSKEGFSFLGYTYKVIDKKTIIKIKKSNYEKVKKRVKEVKYLFDNHKIDYYRSFCTIMTYSNCYKLCSNEKVIKMINRYWYNEK